MSEFEISYKNGKQVVRHPSGRVVECTKAQIEKFAVMCQAQIDKLRVDIQICESSISEIDKSTEITG